MVDRQVIADAYAADEMAAAAEFGAEFRRDVEALIALEALDVVIAPRHRELPPIEGVAYHAFADLSGGKAP